MSYVLEVPRFIREVKKYPPIWDCSHTGSKDKHKKEQAWSAIAKVFIPEFDEMSEMEKNDVYRKLYGKWRNIRDTYVRHTKRKDGKEYIYAKLMAFIIPTIRERNDGARSGGDANDEVEVEIEPQQWSDEEEKIQEFAYKYESTWLPDEDPTTSSGDKKRKRLNNSTNDAIEYVDTSMFSDANKSNIEDDDKAFFDSLLPAVRSFDLDKKIEFRSEVLNLIKKLRKSGQIKNGSGEFEE